MTVSVAIPTYRRERVLVETLEHVLALDPPPDEVLVVDQTEAHLPETRRDLERLERAGVRRLFLPRPSIPHAMNVALAEASGEIVLFLDDDVVPVPGLVRAHRRGNERAGVAAVAGQVLQPGEVPGEPSDGGAGPCWRSTRRSLVAEVIGANFSVKRPIALRVGGFDENFVHVAYCFEAEFCDRLRAAGGRILYEPEASVRHLKSSEGGTRTFGDHLRTLRPSHSVGEYYYLLRSGRARRRLRRILRRPLRSILTRHHLRRPWWIPLTLCAEASGLAWAVRLHRRGPRLLPPEAPGD